MKGSPVTAAVAALALAVGSLSAVGGLLDRASANRKVCQVQTTTNAAVRGLLDDFLRTNPHVSKAQALSTDNLARKRFPVKPC